MEKRLTRGQAIRKKCLDCSANNRAEVKNCPIKDCPLYRYRLGKEIGEK
ncbi:hypothetical protein [uncultured Fusobacterium sp.]|jgi:hypothetical protein|nr:hypothetical protein [uncultured Fusobacterium sp.]